MASIILSTAGSSIGTSVAGQFAGTLVGTLGNYVGQAIDNKIFGPKRLPDYQGPRLAELSVQSSAYGKTIPITYGNVRLAGNIIWSLPIKETATSVNASAGGKGGGGKAVQKQTTYSYSVTLAIGICEGQIDDIIRVWADAEIINPNLGVYRLYLGSEDQNPDPTIEAYEGIGTTPAYRGMAYVVIEDFPLEAYGNRIPNFTFEVRRKINPEDALPNKIKNIVMIPGSGEFAYDTLIQKKTGGDVIGGNFIQRGKQAEINQNSQYGLADAIVSLDQLGKDLPETEWVSVAIGWFGNSLDAANCVLLPGVEYVEGHITQPNNWAVGSFSRATAHAITQVNGRAVYGGTPDDGSIVRYVTELRARGYKIMFYPLIFMDMPSKPWRGRITGAYADVAAFFTKANGYNAFVTHYANLLHGLVDGFCIGSELIGLTKVCDAVHNYAGVNALVGLAQTVKTALGAGAQVTYAADWSEYHHTDGGWYNLDPLWASSYIDVIGIDAYFPLTDEPQSGYDKQKIMDGWTSGEGYDWHYTDDSRTEKAALTPQLAWKNIGYWWNNTHVNPNGLATSWVPASKKIWFTEFGFPSVDGCANQPNVFYDPSSLESKFPRFSLGRVDYRAQATAIEGTLDKWAGSSMVEKLFLWTWDARPYPSFPEFADVWNDGQQWVYGHWVTGKLGLSSLKEMILDLTSRCGFAADNLEFGNLFELVDGFVIDKSMSVRAALESLQKAYFFDVAESGGKLKFITRGQQEAEKIDENDLVPVKDKTLNIKRAQELELPQRVEVNYISRTKNFRVGNESSTREVTSAQGAESVVLPIVLNEWQAKQLADIMIYNIWLARTSYELSLPIKYSYLEPCDVLEVSGQILRITETLLGANGELRVKAVAENNQIYNVYTTPELPVSSNKVTEISLTQLEILDIPAFDVQGKIRFAVCGLGNNWPGSAIFRSDDGGASYQQYSDILVESIMGSALTALPRGVTEVFDEANSVDVSLIHGELESVTLDAILNGANLAVIGNEIIQFRTVTLLDAGKYRLSNLLRGRMGTEWAIGTHVAAERFVMLDNAVSAELMPSYLIGLSRKYKAVSLGKDLNSAAAVDFTYNAVSLKPYAPVHVTASRDGSGVISLSWQRRTRIGGELRGSVDVPLNEESEKYEVEIYNGAELVRTLSVTAPNAIYTDLQQVADFGAVQPSLSIKIYQISAIVGRGTALSAII